mmetsp:Transcript_117860/g.164168  ORF Transcript_117860/g.164168 Transcript_117860/m.164168 type:complete len:147 (+) Transcript_117860:208-648(+)
MEEEEKDFDTLKREKFGLKYIFEKEKIQERLEEVRQNFYNRLESAKLIKKQGRIPFTEHMTITGEQPVVVPKQLDVHDDIKRELAFHNVTRENVMKGMQILVQAKAPISRPDDFLAEMLKSDEHMAKIKSRILKQQTKIKAFEEKR